jgi:AcrR family transcriptional regulator
MTGLRERKRTRTAEAIHGAALQLFAEKGYAETTVDDIATAAEISRATVFRYFPAKEDILFAGDQADGARLLELAATHAGEGLGFDELVRVAILDFASYMRENCDRLWLRWDIASSEERLLGRAIITYARWADDLVAAHGDLEDFRHRVVASTSIACLYEAVRRCHQTREDLVLLTTTAFDERGVGRPT